MEFFVEVVDCEEKKKKTIAVIIVHLPYSRHPDTATDIIVFPSHLFSPCISFVLLTFFFFFSCTMHMHSATSNGIANKQKKK